MFSKKIDGKKVNEALDLSTKVLRVLYLLLITLALYIVLMIFKETKVLIFVKTLLKVVMPLFIGILIAWLFDPFVSFLETKNIKRGFGAFLTYLILFLILYLILAALIPMLIVQIKELVRMAPYILDTVKGWANDLFKVLEGSQVLDVAEVKSEFFTTVEDYVSDFTTTMPSNFIDFVSNLFSFFGTFILGLIIGLFLIVNFDNISKVFNFVPLKYREDVIELFGDINDSLRSYVRGAVIDCGVVFVLTSVGLWAVGLKAPLLFGFFCAITNIIPYAGPYIGGAPAIIVGFAQSPMTGILSLAVICVVQFLEGNFLQPFIMSKTTKLHPVTILLGLLVFGHFFGIVGMIISTPLIATFKTIFKFFDKKYELIKKENMTSHE